MNATGSASCLSTLLTGTGPYMLHASCHTTAMMVAGYPCKLQAPADPHCMPPHTRTRENPGNPIT